MKRFSLILFLVLFFLGAPQVMVGCSSEKEAENDNSAQTSTSAMTKDDQIEAIMNEAMDRLRYKDKSFIYENEFRYYRDKFTFDDYLKERRIASAQADTLEFIDVLNVTYFGEDSAKADVEVHFKGPSGKETIRPEKGVTLYWHEGKWIKPTVSNVIAQKEYDDIIEKAKSASESEKKGSGN